MAQGDHHSSTGWTGKASPMTAGTHSLHAEIAATQVEHWSPTRIKAAEKRGYFDSLTKRALRNTRLGLLAEIAGDEE